MQFDRFSLIAAAGLLTLFHAGCSPSIPEGRFACTAATVAADCPPNWACRADGLCYRTPGNVPDGGTDQGGGGDADVTGDGSLCTAADPADLAAVDANCDGVDGVLGSTGFVYVRHDGLMTGNGDSPAAAVDLARAFVVANSRIATSIDVTLLLAEGAYATSSAYQVEAGDGLLTLVGGYTTDFTARGTSRSVVTSTEESALLIDAAEVTVDSVDFATAANRTTRTVTVVGSPATTLRNLTITAGRGGDGVAGSPGTPNTTTGAVGDDGGDGSSRYVRGSGGGGGASAGGNGSAPDQTADPQNGAPSDVTGTSCGGGGDAGGRPVFTCSCDIINSTSSADGDNGEPGCAGAPGAHGAGGVAAAGTLSVDGAWVPAAGAGPGDMGRPGHQGGGGGGGGNSQCNNINELGNDISSSGGGGGEGGLPGGGGGGGEPGGAGGASIALTSVNSTVTLRSVTLVTEGGGAGGRGEVGGTGSGGGPGGDGGSGFTYAGLDAACGTAALDRVRGGRGGDGGPGGAGGQGGCGGGGAGGPSLGILSSGSVVGIDGTVMFTIGAGGSAGPSCTGGNPGGVGVQQNQVSL
ncbi:MAG: hypothetical protein IPG17_01105 [Sandaracinaceae bacterium]|nr:hypothetical protein [Sandaracinaceae bacterium]